MILKKIIGAVLVASPFIGFFIFAYVEGRFREAWLCLGATAVIAGVIGLGVTLLVPGTWGIK